MRDNLARTLLQIAGEDQPVIHLTAEEGADLAEADAEIARGAFATERDVKALWTKLIP